MHGRLHPIFGPVAEPAHGVTTTDFSGEASQPGTRTPAGVLFPDPVRTTLSIAPSVPFPQGRHRSSRTGRWPRATGLASYPSCCICHLRRTRPFSAPPARSDLIAFLQSPPASRCLPQVAQSAAIRSFFPSRLRHRYVLAAVVVTSQTAGLRITTLAHSSNNRSWRPTVFAPASKTMEGWGITRLRSWFVHLVPLVCRITKRGRSPPGFLVVDVREEERPSPRKPVTCACEIDPAT